MNDSRRDRTLSAPLGAGAKHPPARLGDEGWPAFVRRRGAARIDAGRNRLPVLLLARHDEQSVHFDAGWVP